MDKIINSMITNSNKITDILRLGNEYFFKYDDRYILGILKRKDDVIALSYYSDADEVSDMSHYFYTLDNCIIYFSDSFKVLDSLYKLISEKLERKNNGIEKGLFG